MAERKTATSNVTRKNISTSGTSTTSGAETTYIGAEEGIEDRLAASATKAKVQDTRGLGSYKPKPAVEETDVSKMTPLARAAYLARKKREKQAQAVEK